MARRYVLRQRAMLGLTEQKGYTMKRYMLVLIVDGSQFVVWSDDFQKLLEHRTDAEFSIGNYTGKKCYVEMYEYEQYKGYVRIY